MWQLVIVVLWASFRTSFSDHVPVINIILVKTDIMETICQANNVEELSVNEEFHVSVTSDVAFMATKCFPSNNNDVVFMDATNFISEESAYSSTTEVLKYKMQAKRSMSGQWTCAFQTGKCTKRSRVCKYVPGIGTYLGATCSFTVNVKDNDMSGTYLLVNGRQLNSKKTDPKVRHKHFNAFAYYSFYEGEPATISCETQYKTARIVQLSYTKNVNETVSTGLQTSYVELYLKLTEADDNGYIDCRVSDYSNPKLAIGSIRLYLRLTVLEKDIWFQVNGLILPPLFNHKMKHVDYYFEYEYYDGEELTILSEKDRSKYGNMQCMITAGVIPNQLSDFSKTYYVGDINSTVVLKKENDNLLLSCVIDCLLDSEDTNKILTIRLAQKAYIFHNYVSGLSMTNVSARYINDNTRFVYYQHGGEDLNLTCSSLSPNPEWSVGGNISYNFTLINNYLLTGAFTFNDNQTGAVTIIRCKSQDGTKTYTTSVELTVKRKKEVTEEDVWYDAKEIQEPDDKDEGESQGNGNTGLSDTILAGAASATLIIIIVVAWLVISLHKRKRKAQSLIKNESQSAQNDRFTPAPRIVSQVYASPSDTAETDTYSVPYTPKSVEELYATPVPKNRRMLPESVCFKNSAYATPKFDSEPTYAQPTPKNLRGRNRNGVNNESSYATVNPHTEYTDKGATSENPYEVENAYAVARNGADNSSYVNTFDEQTYANTKTEDLYAEPAYCQVHIKK